ncbi:VOC family protein [Rhizobacter fulvus]|jgi:predicted enzyme related to lactoylglutathione lyase
MDAFQTPGAFSWCELMSTDPTAATAFYAQLFGWKLEAMNMGMPYHVVKVGDAAIGGIMGMPPGSPPGLRPTWVPYVTVADVDALVRQVVALGGKVMMPPADIPSVGRFAVIADPQGATLNVITYAMPGG